MGAGAQSTLDEQQTPEAARVRFWTPSVYVAAGVLGLFAVAALLFGNLVTRLFVVLVVLTTLNGYWLGAARVAASAVGFLVALLLAVPMGKLVEPLVSTLVGTTGLANRMLSIGICGAVQVMVVGVALSVLFARFLKRRPEWRRFDRLIGTGVGLVDGAIFGAFLIWAVLLLEPMAGRYTGQSGRSDRADLLRRNVLTAAASVRQSAVGRAAGVVNPLKEMQMFALLNHAQTVLADPRAREVFVNHPTMQRIRERPAVRRTLELLANEPALVEFEDGLSDEELRDLLQSPRLLAILDETGLLRELAPISADIERALEAALPEQP